MGKLTDDVHTLLGAIDAPHWTTRAKAVERIASLYCNGNLGAATRQAAEDAFRQLCCDGEPVVRRLLIECLKDSPDLPRDIALMLASSETEVGLAFLTASPSLDAADLLVLVQDGPGPRRHAIARRRHLPKAVSEALCRCRDAGAIRALLRNETATIGATTLTWLLETSNDPELAGAIAEWRVLPIGIGGYRRAPSRIPADAALCGTSASTDRDACSASRAL